MLLSLAHSARSSAMYSLQDSWFSLHRHVGLRDHYLYRGVSCSASKRSQHPNRQGIRDFQDLQGQKSEWITVPVPSQSVPRQLRAHTQRHQQTEQPTQHIRKKARLVSNSETSHQQHSDSAVTAPSKKKPGPRQWKAVSSNARHSAFVNEEKQNAQFASTLKNEGYMLGHPSSLDREKGPASVQSSQKYNVKRMHKGQVDSVESTYQQWTQEDDQKYMINNAITKPNHDHEPNRYNVQSTLHQHRHHHHHHHHQRRRTANESDKTDMNSQPHLQQDQGTFIATMHSPEPEAAAQVLSTASQLASLAGPHMALLGSRKRERLKPVQPRLFAGVFGQTRDPFWRWRQQLRSGRHPTQRPTPMSTIPPTSSSANHNHTTSQVLLGTEATVISTTSHSQAPVQNTSPQAATQPASLADTKHGSRHVRRKLCVLDMDDWDLDLDHVDEGITEEMLHRSRHAMEAALARDTLKQLQSLAIAITEHGQDGQTSYRARSVSVAGQLPLKIYKGGGYIAADLEAVLLNLGLTDVLQLQFNLQGAACILAMRRWKSGKQVYLRQQMAAAAHRHIPLVLTQSLRPTDLMLALRPILLDTGLVVSYRDGKQHRRVVRMSQANRRNTRHDADSSSDILSHHNISTHHNNQEWPLLQPKLLQDLEAGNINVSQYIQMSKLL